MLSEINQHIPDNWQDAYNSNCTQFEVSSFREEYTKLINEVKQCVDGEINVRRVLRVQNSYAYGQFLIREQLLIALNEEQVYRVRRFLTMDSILYQNKIIKYNLDPRRCALNQNFMFAKDISCGSFTKLIVVAKCLTTQPTANYFTPKSSSDYYVEYIIVLN